MKCDEEDYLIKKFESLIGDIDEFIEQELKIIRDKEILSDNNKEAELLKIDVDEDSEELELPEKTKKTKIKLENSPSKGSSIDSNVIQVGDYLSCKNEPS